MTKDELYFLNLVAEEMGIKELSSVDVIRVQWTGEKVWNIALRLAKLLEIENLRGQQEGIKKADKILKEVNA